MSRKWNMLWLVLALVLLGGCSLRTLDQLYQVPKRPDDYSNLQSAIDRSLGNLEYCAPLSGENLQAVQMADLDGDGSQEYLLFAKGGTEKPLLILIFHMIDGSYALWDTIESYGSAFDMVEYAQMDDRPGFELIVGCQISEQVARSVSVYSFWYGHATALMDASYTRFLSCDFGDDGVNELLVLRPGEEDEDDGLAELYSYQNGSMARLEQVQMSGPAERMKRIVAGKLHGGQPAVYVASSRGDDSAVTDIFSVVDGVFTNVSRMNEAGADIKMLLDQDIYADDLDGDGVLELPSLVEMKHEGNRTSGPQYLIRWYSVTSQGQQIDKLYTLHNLQNSWYMVLDKQWAVRVTVQQQGSACEFYVWDEGYTETEKIMTVYYLAGPSREELASKHNRFVVYKGASALYAAHLESNAEAYGITQDRVINSFRLLLQDRKTQEVSK